MQSAPQQQAQENLLELEHSIGYSGKIPKCVFLHPNQKDFVYISGASIVITDLNDPHQQSFLRGHDDQVTCLAVSNQGNLIASGQRGDNSDVIIWDYKFKKVIFKLSEHDFEVVAVQFSHDDKLLLSVGNPSDKKLFIWDTSNGYIVASCHIQPERISAIRWGGFAKDIKGRDTQKYQFASAGNKQICLWKLDTQKGLIEHEFINTGNMIREYICLEFSRNREDYLFAGTTSGDFCCFQMKNKILSVVVTVSAQGVQSICSISPTQVVVGCGNGTYALYEIDGNKVNQIKQIQLNGQINSISCSSDLKECMCSTDRGFVYKTRNSDLACILQCENHTDSVAFITYPPGISDKFASASEDGTIRLWDISQDYVVTQNCFANMAGSPLCLVYNDEIVLSGWQDGKIRMFSTETGKLIWQIDNAHKGGVYTLSLAKNLKFFCSGGNEGEVRVWEMRSREMVSHLKEHTQRVSKVRLTLDEMHVLSSSKDRALLLWDLKMEKRISAHIQRMGGINSFDMLPNTNIVLTTGQDRKITFWDLNHANALLQIPTNNNPKDYDECFDLSISKNGKWFATGGSETIVKLWDVEKKVQIGEGRGHSGSINTVQFSYDDKQLVSGGRDGNIFLWNVFAE